MLDCRAARSLLDQGVTPGSRTPERAALGFHLARCAECQNYRAALQQQLLAEMLGQVPQRAPVAAAPPAPPAPPVPTLRDQLWRIGLLSLSMVGLALVLVLGARARAMLETRARAVLVIHQNLQAMIVTATPPNDQQAMVAAAGRASEIAATAMPTVTPSASPTATSLPTPTKTPVPATLVVVTPTNTLVPVILNTPTPAPPPAGDAVNVLLLGIDRRPGEGDRSRSDAIIVAHIDPQQQRVALLSLPRDLRANIPDYGYARVNAAHAYGGAELARQTVSALLGIPIDHYVVIDFEGFIGAVDSLGGVTVDVEKELYDPQFPTMDYGYTTAHFLPGPQHMDGATALMYSRVRHPDSDFARMRRQQAVLASVLAQVRDAGTLGQLDQLAALTTALRDYVRTDMPEERMLGLAWALQNLTPAQLERYSVTPDMVTFGSGSDQWIEVPVPGTLEGLTGQLLGR